MFKTTGGDKIFLDVNKITSVLKCRNCLTIQYGFNNTINIKFSEFSKLEKVVKFMSPEPIDITFDFEKEKRKAFEEVTKNVLKKMRLNDEPKTPDCNL